MDLHRLEANRQLLQQAAINDTAQRMSCVSPLMETPPRPLHLPPVTVDNPIGGLFSSPEAEDVLNSNFSDRSSSQFLSVPKLIRRTNSPSASNLFNRRKHCALSDIEVSNISSNQLECPMCPYKATVNSRLREHVRQHTGERPFVCSVCNKGFGRKTHLDTHMVIHSGEKPFKCTICSYSATQKGNLKIHMQSHTGEKPHACLYCNYRAAQKLTLRLHVYNKHPEFRSSSV